jgi:hypothetical protein
MNPPHNPLIGTLTYEAPARGAQLGQVIPASIVALAVIAVVGWFSVRHRRGTFGSLTRAGTFAERVSGRPGWAALPTAIAVVSLTVAAFGFYWDVSWHIDRGRDPGPFSNPAHFFIIFGLAGTALAGWIAVLLGTGRRTSTSVRVGRNWDAPVGGLLLLVCGVIALAGFPLDDVWHTLFGQDVTLWGPTHIQMIGGASLATLAMWALFEEGRRDRQEQPRGLLVGWLVRHQNVLLGGAALLGLSTLQGEFDYGVPQFRQLYQPVLIMLAASIALVAVRIRGRRGSALGAVLFFLAVRGTLALLIGPVLGRTTLHFPLYLLEAALVEMVALRISTERQLTFGVACGAAIGTVGLAAEWAWSHIWMPLPWPSSLFPGAVLLGAAAALAGGLVGGMIGRSLSPLGAGRQRSPRGLAVTVWIVVLFVIGFPMPMTAHTGYRADVSLSPARALAKGWVRATVRLHPANAASEANWFDVTSWQGARRGSGGLVIAPLEPLGDGTYRTTARFPVFGEWKSLLRLHVGRSIQAVPIYMPADRAIPAPQVAAFAHVQRHFEPDKRILQREAVGGSVVLERIAYVLLGVLGVVWVAGLAWAFHRLDRTEAPWRELRSNPAAA